MPAPPRPVTDRFWEKVSPEPNTGCHLWTGATFRDTGYGAFRQDGKARNAHRVAWELVNGPVPDGLCVLHHCDTPACVFADPDPRKSHLFLGTVLDNTRDMDAKGRRVNAPPRGARHGSRTKPESIQRGARHWTRRHPEKLSRMARGDRNGARLHPDRVARGEHVHGARLSADDVRQIRARRADGATLRELADAFGVHISTIWQATSGETWAHVA